MGLVAADLRVLGNLLTTADGRRVATSTFVGLALFALMSWWIADALVDRPDLLAMLHRETRGGSLQAVIGYGLMACPLVATWYGLSLAQRQLFEAPELLLWRLAPQAAVRAPLQALLRASLVSSTWAFALTGPFVGAFLRQSPAPLLAWCMLPLAIVCCTMPLLATLLAVQVVLVRWFAGRALRLVLTVVMTLASLGFFAWFLLALFTPSQARVHDIAAAARDAGGLPWTVDTAAAMLSAVATGRFDWRATAGAVGWLAAALGIFLFAARQHPRAWERQLEAAAGFGARFGRRWPAGAAGAVRKKEFAQLLQQPGALLGFVLFPLLVFGLAHRRLLIGGILANPRLPDCVATLGAMLALWFVAVMLVLYAHMGRMAVWDGPQWSLYMASPTPPGRLVRGKLAAIATLMLWPLLVVAVAGGHLLGADRSTLSTFLAVAIGGTFAALGVLAALGTWPRLMRPDEGGHVLQGARNFVAAILLVFAFDLVTAPGWLGWIWLDHLAREQRLEAHVVRPYAPLLAGAALAWGSLVGLVGAAIGTRHYRRLLTPR
ncbi:MAG: hypothetical protein IT455_05555 [Planctomycetes bacterium]|nr:hypothetical protein [Planctomycetota bacterium]